MADKENKSLADLEIDQKTSEVESADDNKHEHKHSDELSYKEDPGQIKRTHGMLFFIAMGALALVLVAAGYLIVNFEGGRPSLSGGGTQQSAQQTDENSLISLYGHIFYSNDGSSPEATFVDADDTSRTESFSPRTGGSLAATESRRNATWQVSRDGKVIAYQMQGAKEIIIENKQESKSAFAGEAIASIEDWLLLPDGSRIIARVSASGKQQLLDYSLNTDSISAVDMSTGATSGRLQHGADGAVRLFNFSGSSLQLRQYWLEDKSIAETTIESPRFPDNPQQFASGMSPDGTVFVYRYVFNNLDYIGLVSLNSQVVRSIYKTASSGVSIADVRWAPDSRTLLISEAEGGAVKRLIKLDSGPLTSETLIDANTPDLNPTEADVVLRPTWSKDTTRIAFYSSGTIWNLQLADKGLTQLMSDRQSPNAATVYGWYARQPVAN